MARTIETRMMRASRTRHVVRVDADHHAIAVLCNRVTLDRLADRDDADPFALPTCAVCLGQLVTLLREQGGAR